MRSVGATPRTSLLLVVLMLLPMLPLQAVSAADVGDPWMLQAQGIEASFETNSESTVITWNNIDDADVAEELWGATYHLYRHDVPMNASMIENMTPFASVEACDSLNVPNPNNCRGSRSAGAHSATFQVAPGVNGSFYYAITTELSNGTVTMALDNGSSHLADPVDEITTPVRSPYYLQAEFKPSESRTVLSWVNYNIINAVLPETGPDAYEIHIWQHSNKMDRSNGLTLIGQSTPIATLAAGVEEYSVTIPPSTSRQVYYSVTYLLKNFTGVNETYEDVRFLSGNTLSEPVMEDNIPPEGVQGVSAEFTAEANLNGEGWTYITWSDVLGEDEEIYRIWRSGSVFSNTSDEGVTLVATIQEGVESYNYSLDRGNLGPAYYCVSIIDSYGITSSELDSNACDMVENEDTFGDWVKEPTNVYAEYLGAAKTRVSWTDQVGAEGETYNVWWSSYPVVVTNPANPVEFKTNGTAQNMFLLATVPDGFGEVIVDVPQGIYRTQSYYFVTSVARYGHLNDTYEYRGLEQNYFGPVAEDTSSPAVPVVDLESSRMLGLTGSVTLTWLNDEDESDEAYSIWRHLGEPFADVDNQSVFRTNVTLESGWELMMDDIKPNNAAPTVIRSIPVAEGIERKAWYAVIQKDEFDNLNNEAWTTPGKNAVLLREDARTASVEMVVWDSNDEPSMGTLTSGSYRLMLNISEDLEKPPMVNISTPDRVFTIGSGEEANLYIDTPLDDTIGDVYYLDFEVAGTDDFANITIVVEMVDSVGNKGNVSQTDWQIDAKLPTVIFYTPGAPTQTTYMEGDSILISGGASDDVGVTALEIRFITSSTTTRWMDISEYSTISEDGWAFAYPSSVADNAFGTIRAEVRATDAAGNQNMAQVSYKTDSCHHTINGTTYCLKGDVIDAPPPTEVFESMNLTDGPFLFVFILAAVNIFAIIVVVMVVITTLSAPRRKKGDDEDEGDEWMSEFIGTSGDPDMDSITNTAPKEEEKTQVADDEDDDEDDPFAVNQLQRKERRKKKSDDDDDGDGKKRRSVRRKK